MSTLLYTAAAQPLRLGPPLGVGGEGTVYELPDTPALVAKLYHEPLAPARAEKLALLAQRGNERLRKLTAWPVEVLRRQPDGPIAGFTMQRIGQAEEVHALHSPKSRLQKFPDASWAFLIYVAANIARAVATVHEHGLVVGDLNPKNILVTRQATVYLLDCDSFQLTADGKTYRCEHGFPEYTPPELQGVAFRDVDRTATHDAFGLAVIVFQLLFLGRHPFSGKALDAGELPLERAIREGRFAYGDDAALRGMHAPPGTLALAAVSEPVAALFRRAFLAPDRPQPRAWVEALEALAQRLQRCAAHSGHQFYQELAACPWCAIETRARTRLFNFALNGQAQTAGHFRLADIWQEIESVAPPQVPKLVTALTAVQQRALSPSAEAQAVAARRQSRFYLALLVAAASGVGISVVADFPFAFYLLIFAGILAGKLANPELPAQGQFQPVLQAQPGTADESLALQLEQTRREAQEALQNLKQRWREEASAARFQAKRKELAAQTAAYKKLATTPLEQLRPFEVAELNAARQHLEREISSGPSQLRQLQQEIVDSQRFLREPLRAAQMELAQSQWNLGLVAKRNPVAPLIVLLLVAFCAGSWWEAGRKTEKRAAERVADRGLRERPVPLPLDAEAEAEATRLYDQANDLLRARRYKQAIPLYLRAVELNARLAAGWQELGFAYYQTGQYQEAVRTSEKALWLAQSFQAYYVIGLAAEKQRDWQAAKQAYESAARRDWGEVPQADYWGAQFGLAQALHRVGEAPGEIQVLRELLANKPTLVEERFQLAALYWFAGQHNAARQQLALLAKQDATAAAELRRHLKPQPVLIRD